MTKKILLIVAVVALGFASCSKKAEVENSNVEPQQVQPMSSESDPYIDYLESNQFRAELDNIELNFLRQNLYNIEVKDNYQNVGATNEKFDPNEVNFPTAVRTIKVVITPEDNSAHPLGIYFLDLCTGAFHNLLGDLIGTAAGYWPGEPCDG